MTFERSTHIITRAEVRANPQTLYVFGDNTIRKGLGGQAKEMRGEPNTAGIITKLFPNNHSDSFMVDEELPYNMKLIKRDVDDIAKTLILNPGKYTKVIIPPIGEGLAKLSERAPKTWLFLNEEIDRLEKIIDGLP